MMKRREQLREEQAERAGYDARNGGRPCNTQEAAGHPFAAWKRGWLVCDRLAREEGQGSLFEAEAEGG